jgi:hypothetical protein
MKSAEIGGILGCSHDTVIRKCGREGIALLARPYRIVGISPGSIRRNPNDLLPLEERIGVGRAVLALGYQHCKWPIGSPTEEDFHFCSAPRIDMSRPYCKEHTASSMSGK